MDKQQQVQSQPATLINLSEAIIELNNIAFVDKVNAHWRAWFRSYPSYDLVVYYNSNGSYTKITVCYTTEVERDAMYNKLASALSAL